MRNAFRKNNFIERAIRGALLFFEDTLFSEEQASLPGYLQSLDPRVKSITFLLLCLAVLITNSIYVLIPLYLFTLLLAFLSKINLGFFVKRTWVFIPLFSLLIAVPALFDFVSPGEPLITFKLFGLSPVITQQGLASASFFILRVSTSVSLVILLNLTTRHSLLLRVLRIFKIPQVFVMVLGMSYRYIYLFMEIVEKAYLGIKSRTGGLIHYKKGQSIVAWNIATLWQRSFKLNEDVYNAMLSRGYSREVITLEEFKVSFRDWIWLCLVIIIFGAVAFFKYG